MKQNAKVFLIALLIGIGASYIFCYKRGDVLISNALNTKATCFYVGTYNNIEEAKNKQSNYENSIIYNEKGIYKVVIGVYTDREVIDLMASYFEDQNIKFYTKEIKITGEYINRVKNYEELIKTSSKEYYKSLNLSILKTFNEYIN